MKGKCMIPLASAVIMMTACSGGYEDALDTEKDLNDYTACEHILDGIDAAYNSGYTKFDLPEKEALHITQPEGVYTLELEYVNKGNDTDWKADRVRELQEVFGTSYGTDVNTDNGNAVLGDPDRACVGIGISDPYAFWEWNSRTVTILERSSIEEIETITINEKTKKDMSRELIDDIEKSKELGTAVKKVIGEDLDPLPYDAYVFKNAMVRAMEWKCKRRIRA